MIARTLKSLAAICGVTLLAGCVGYTPQETQQGAGNTSVIQIVDAPEVVYRRMVVASRTCFTPSLDTTADWFADSRTGRIAATMRVTFGVSTLYVLDIAPDGTGTRVSAATHKSVTKLVGTLTAWANGASPPPCDIWG